MVVYKTLYPSRKQGYFKSAVQDFTYKRGMHYYQTGKKKVSIEIRASVLRGYIYRMHTGLHSYLTLNKAKNNCFLGRKVVVKMIIPKGATVWINEKDKFAVSTELIFPYE